MRTRFAISAFLGLVCWMALSEAGQAGEPRWVEAVHIDRFVYRADCRWPDRQQVLGELIQLRDDLGEILRLPIGNEIVELYLFEDEGAYRDYLRQRFGDLPLRRALFIKAGGPGMVFAYQGMQLAIDLRHETTHALLHAALDAIPLWLDEGLAEYFESPRDERATAPRQYELLDSRLRRGPITRIEALQRLDDTTGMAGDDYVDAWAWAHFLIHGPAAARGELIAYLQELRSKRPAEPLSERLRRRLPELERQFDAHHRLPATTAVGR